MFGYHVGKHGGSFKEAILAAIEQLSGYGFIHPAVQIFVTGPRSSRRIISDEDIKQCKELISKYNLQIVIHGAYIDSPWSLKANCVHNIREELRISDEIGAQGVIVHLGAKTLENLHSVMLQIGSDFRSTLWFEVHVAKQNTFCTSGEISHLFKQLSQFKTNVGFCIDTAHLFSCGVGLFTSEDAANWISALPNFKYMLHLNDSASKLGSGKDKHAALTKGNIWGRYKKSNIQSSGLVTLLNWAENNHILTILERDKDEIPHDLKLISELGFFQ